MLKKAKLKYLRKLIGKTHMWMEFYLFPLTQVCML